MKILLTGAAGFIGSHVAEKLLAIGHHVIGVDNFDAFYSRGIKESNLSKALTNNNYKFIEADLCDEALWINEFLGDVDAIIHLAAKAGVRPSMIDPVAFNKTNILGTSYLLEFARKKGIIKIVFASSSSVYGVNENLPWSVDDKDLKPISVYAYSKQCGEKLCEFYHNFYHLKIVALRFFTVYGPRQRPDLAIHKFVRAIINGDKVTMYGNGNTFRDYTYIDDIVTGVISALNYDNKEFEIFNLGNTHTVSLIELVTIIEELLGKKADIEYLPEQPGDVPFTWSNTEKTQKLLNFAPKTDIKFGIGQFINWYKSL